VNLYLKYGCALLFIFFAGIGMNSGVVAQEKTPTKGFEVNMHGGYLITPRATTQHIPDHRSLGLELRYIDQASGEKAWHRSYKFPRQGFSVMLIDLGNYELLGYGIGFSYFLGFPIIRRDRFSLNYEIGAGPGIVTQPYNDPDNYKNPAIGSYLNIYAATGFKVAYRIGEKLAINASASFIHFSNAHINLPNMGVNYPLLGFGMTYLPQPPTLEPDTSVQEKLKGKWSVSLMGSIKESDAVRDVKFPVGVFRLERSFGLSRKSQVGIGVDAMFNSARISESEAQGDTLSSALLNTQIGISANYHLVMGRITLMVGTGWLLYSASPDFRTYYNRSGMRYAINEGWAINATVKTYIFRADYIEIGLVKYF